MKKSILNIVQIIAFLFIIICSPTFAQTGQKGSDYPTITKKNLAVIVIDFPDTPKSTKDQYFPTVAALKDTIFNGSIKKYLSDMSYGQFTLTGDVFGYFTHQNPGFVNGKVTELYDILKINTVSIPGFDISRYDGVILISINDAGLAGGVSTGDYIQINGISVFTDIVFVPINIGFQRRDPINYPAISNNLIERQRYGIPISTDHSTEGTSPLSFSYFDRTFSHEFIHYLGIRTHADARTNGSSYDYEPEVSNNDCKCYGTGSLLGSLMHSDYGNKFDVMGKSEYGMSLNMAFRDYLGWTNSTNRYSINNYGHYNATVFPLNNLNGIRTVEIRVPYQYGDTNKKNQGYFLEVRSAGNNWDNMLLNPQLIGNNDGIMVVKTNGTTSELLDMSPSPNISFYGQIAADIRDVVLKPGMVYYNKEIKMSNVKKNADGSFSIDLDVFVPATITAGGPTTLCQGNSVILTSSSAISYLWSNGATTQNINVSTSGNYSVTVDNGSGSSSTSNILAVTVNPLPSNAGTITGTASVCQGQNSINYTVPAVANATSYVWTLQAGITGSSTTNSITLSYGASAVSGNISVKGHNDCGDGVASTFPVVVNPIPSTPIITQNGKVLSSNATSGNQWYNQNIPINGATAQDYTITTVGEYTVQVTVKGCISAPSNMIKDLVTSISSLEYNETIKVYPNPVSDDLTIEYKGNTYEIKFGIYSSSGQLIITGVLLESTVVHTSMFSSGVYTIKFNTGKTFEFRKVIKRN